MKDKYILLIYNPVSGNKSFSSYLDYFIRVFQNKGYETHIYRTKSEEDFSNVVLEKDMTYYEAIFVAGGDGSINLTVNQLIKSNIDIPLGIIPAGTMNDICFNIGIPNDIKKAIDILSSMHIDIVDVGVVNDRYFLNCCGVGLFMDVSINTDTELKNMMGQMAYFFNSIKELPNFKKLNFKIENDNEILHEQLYLFLVMNGKSAGGFHNIGYEASMKDGLLDFIGIKACSINELSILFAKMLIGNYLSNKNVIHFKSKKMIIESLDSDYNNVSDVDGEKGPKLPLNISVIPSKFKIITSSPIQLK